MKRFSNLNACLFLVALCGCGKTSKTPEKSTQEAPMPKKESPQTARVEKAVFEGPGEYLVNAVNDWQLSGNPRYFGPDNLYDLINGGAEVYTEYGLKKMVTADYKSKARQNVTVTAEIYDMGSSMGAFGRFSRFLDGAADPSKSGEGLSPTLAPKGRFGGASASFYKGSFLVNLTLLDESPTATMESIKKLGAAVLPKFADSLFQKVPQGEPLSKVLEHFPKDNLLKRSEGYAPKSYANIDGICPCFTARYKKDKTEWTLFVTAAMDNQQAVDSMLKKIGEANAGIIAQKVNQRIVGYKSTSDDVANTAQASLKDLAAEVSSM